MDRKEMAIRDVNSCRLCRILPLTLPLTLIMLLFAVFDILYTYVDMLALPSSVGKADEIHADSAHAECQH